LNKTSGLKLQQGQIWKVKDTALQMPSTNPRTLHHFRGVILLTSNEILASDPECETILVAPLSTDLEWLDEYHDVILHARPGGVREESRVVLSLIQPVLKHQLEEILAQLTPFELLAIKNKMASIFGATPNNLVRLKA